MTFFTINATSWLLSLQQRLFKTGLFKNGKLSAQEMSSCFTDNKSQFMLYGFMQLLSREIVGMKLGICFVAPFKTLNFEEFSVSMNSMKTPTHVTSALLLFCSAFIESQVEQAFKWVSSIQEMFLLAVYLFIYWLSQFLFHHVPMLQCFLSWSEMRDPVHMFKE